MKRAFLYLFVIASLLVTIFLAGVFSIDDRKLLEGFLKDAKITQTASDKVHYKVKRFPEICLIIDHIRQDNKIELQNTVIKFSPLSVLKFDYKVSEIMIDQARLYLSNDNVNLLEHDEFIGELIGQDRINISAKIAKLIFVESDNDIPFTIDNFIINGGNDRLSDAVLNFSGKTGETGSIQGVLSKNGELARLDLTISNNDYKLQLEEEYQQAVLKKGKLAVITSDFAENLAQTGLEFTNLFEKFNGNEEVEVNLDIEKTDKALNLKNIVISSPSIEGKGDIELGKNKNDPDIIKLDFSRIDLDKFARSKNLVANSNKGSAAISSFNMLRKPIIANISASQVKLSNTNVIGNLVFSAQTKNGALIIDNFSGMLNKDGQFKVTGHVSQNAFRTIFQGQIALAHNDLNDLVEIVGNKTLRSENKIPYSLVADAKLSPVDISLQNLHLKTEETDITGGVLVKFIGNSPRTNAHLKFTRINLDKKNFPVFRHMYDSAMDLASGSKKDNYLNKFIPLRKISSTCSYDIVFDQLILNNTVYKNFSFNLGLSPGRITLDNLSLDDDRNSLEASLDLIASEVKPVLGIVIHSGNVKTDFISPSRLLALRKNVLENVALDKIALNMNFVLNKVDNQGFTLGRVIFKAKNTNNLLEINNFEADVLGGRISCSGSILLEPLTANFVYALNSARMSEIANALPTGILNNAGFLGINGMFSTNGNTSEELLYNLYTKSGILAKDILIRKFGIDNLVETVNKMPYDVKNLQDDVKKALLTGETEIGELKASVELSKGIFNLPQIDFKTKYTSGTASANFNLYNFNLNLASALSFYVNKIVPGRGYTDRKVTKITMTATGNLLGLKKEADIKELQQILTPQEILKGDK